MMQATPKDAEKKDTYRLLRIIQIFLFFLRVLRVSSWLFS